VTAPPFRVFVVLSFMNHHAHSLVCIHQLLRWKVKNNLAAASCSVLTDGTKSGY
jgi:hypothetical protein